MRILGKFIAFLLVLLLIIALPLSLLSYDVGRVLFNQGLVNEILTNILVDSDLMPIALKYYVEQRVEERYGTGEAIAWQDEPSIIDLLSFVDVDDWKTIRKEVLTDEILREWVSITVDGVYAWIDSDDLVPKIVWSMQSFKEQVSSRGGHNAVQFIYDALPPCTEQEVADFKARAAATEGGIEVFYNLCQFPDIYGLDQVDDYHDALVAIVEYIPDEFFLTEELSSLLDVQGISPLTIKAQLLLIRTSMRWAPLIPVVLLLLILLFAVRSLRELGNWWGIPLLLGGLLSLGLGLVYRTAIISALSFGSFNEIPPLVREEALSGIMLLAAEIFKPVIWQSLIVVVLGTMLIIVGVAVRPKKSVEQEAVA